MSSTADDNEAINVAVSREEEPMPHPKRPKRTRIQLACQRCKIRKQKCDGSRPKCSTCNRLEVDCRYVMPVTPKPQEAKIYISALENRVAELEMALTNGGLSDAALDHWTQRQRESQAKGDEDGQEVYTLLSAVRDVSLNTSGSFIGGTSTITLARILDSILGQQGGLIASPEETSSEYQGDFLSSDHECRSTADSTFRDGNSPNPFREMQSNMADKLLLAYFKHVAVNFPVVHSAQIRDFHRRREILNDPYEESVLNLVYALGGQFLEMFYFQFLAILEHELMQSQTREPGNFQWRYHYEAALANRDKILRLGDTRTLAYLLLLVQQCLRVPRDPGGWTFIGIAMRLCVELGLHRKKRRYLKPSLESELEKRLFWVCYYFDRDIAIALGRPPCISDNDIDVELPLDVDEECQDSEILERTVSSNTPAFPPTTLTCFLHTVRLKRIESKIQAKIYRVDVEVDNLALETEQFLETLAAWKDAIPHNSNMRDDHGMNAYMLHYYKCTRLLLQPQLYETVINDRYLKLCTEACAGVCESYRRLHDYFPVAFSTLSLQTVFLAGLTLVYCMWHTPSPTALKNMSALSDCSIMLYIMTERWPNIRRYRDAFEAIKRSVLELMAEDKHQPRKVIPEVIGDVWSSLQSIDFDLNGGINRDDLEHMFGDMTSDRMQFPPWNDVSMDMCDPLTIQNDNMGPQINILNDNETTRHTGWDENGEMNSLV